MIVADLHIHSRYSRATSRELDFVCLDLWARRKGIGLIGTGDFTHPAWREEMRAQLVAEENGLYALRPELTAPDFVPSVISPRFVVSGEISCIYKQDGKTRKVHNLILLPSIEAAEALSARLERIGNVRSDGRPILGLSSRDLAEIAFSVFPDAVFIPAHIWTPHFSVLGAFSGFDSVEQCFGDMSPYIHALETGLSSDPPMNRRVSCLDRYRLVSNSDAHSASKLGREANLLDIPLDYAALRAALETGEGLSGTVEFYPEEGKYHLDGHRNCHVRLTPDETRKYGGLCPVCGKKVTVGVLNRVEALADRPEDRLSQDPSRFEYLVPLSEVVASSMGVSATSVKADAVYRRLLATLGPELTILRERDLASIRQAAGCTIAEGVRRLRAGEVTRLGGYDGEYGRISLFTQQELESLKGQLCFLGAVPQAADGPTMREPAAVPARSTPVPAAPAPDNDAQRRAIECTEHNIAVLAGPGTGKTHTLIARIASLLERGVPPASITAVTFTRQAAAELSSRVRPYEKSGRVRVGTFHALAQQLLSATVIDRATALLLAEQVIGDHGLSLSPVRFLAEVSARKNGAGSLDDLPFTAYQTLLEELGAVDFDDLLTRALEVDPPACAHLLVDEFQDVDPAQYRLALHWSRHCDLFVIGDPDQAIYGFRGAMPDCFERLARDRQTATFTLGLNYRSTPEILSCAASSLSKRPLRAVRPAGTAVRLVDTANEFEEAIFIAREIERLTGGMDMLQAGRRSEDAARSFSDIAVLGRTHRVLQRIETALLRQSVPCRVYGREDWLDDRQVRGALGLARWVISADRAGLVAAAALLWSVPYDEARILSADTLPPAMRALVSQLGEDTGAPVRLFEAVARALDLTCAAYARLLETAAQYESTTELLDSLAAGEETDVKRGGRAAYDPGAVRLMTLHGAKGLEFPVVFLAGLSEGVLPHARAADRDMEEERRSFYVGLTRARDELILTAPGAPSPFLRTLSGVKRGSAERTRRATQLSMF